MKRFDDQVAVVTGAGNGIGLAIAHAFAAEGAQVVIAEIREASGESAVAEIRAAGGKAILAPTDVADEAQVRAMVGTALAQLGRIDILVNNAGIVVHKLLIDLDRDAWDRQLAVQLTAPFLTIKLEWRISRSSSRLPDAIHSRRSSCTLSPTPVHRTG